MSATILPFPARPRPGAPEIDVAERADGGIDARVRCYKALPFVLDAVGLVRTALDRGDGLDWRQCHVDERRDGLEVVYDVTIPPRRSTTPTLLRRSPGLDGGLS